jgi:hypothetical protein
MKAILILMALLGMLMFGLIVATATPNDREEYEKYMKWKERKRKDEPQKEQQTDCAWK